MLRLTTLARAIHYIELHAVHATVDQDRLILSDTLDDLDDASDSVDVVDIVDGLVSLTEVRLILGY